MTPLWWMTGGTVAAWLVVTAVAAAMGASVHPELLAGLLGPLASAAATWVVVVRTWSSNPARLLGVMKAGFAAKMLFFGVYVVVALQPLGLRPMPFVVSFASAFITLHLAEALFLQRLFAGASHAAGSRVGPDV